MSYYAIRPAELERIMTPERVKAFEDNNFDIYGIDDSTLFDELYEFFVNSGEMPYGTAKARDGDPDQWISEVIFKEYGE